METLILPAIHLSLLLAFIAYKTKTPFFQFMAERREEILDGLNKAKKQAHEAELKKKQIELKISNLLNEKQKILKDWKEKEVLQAQAIRESSERILRQMKNEGEQNKRSLEAAMKLEIRNHIGMLVVRRAEAKISKKLNHAVHEQRNHDFLMELAGEK